jgi:hypothetical protein
MVGLLEFMNSKTSLRLWRGGLFLYQKEPLNGALFNEPEGDA